MGQVPAHGEAHAKNRIARFQQREIHRLVGLRTGIGLHVGRIGTEQFLHTIDRKLLDHIDKFATAVITFARIAFGVFVGELRALRFHHRRAGVIFGGDQFDVIFLPLVFVLNRGKKLGIDNGNGLGAREGWGHDGDREYSAVVLQALED